MLVVNCPGGRQSANLLIGTASGGSAFEFISNGGVARAQNAVQHRHSDRLFGRLAVGTVVLNTNIGSPGSNGACRVFGGIARRARSLSSAAA